jgi:malate/lactate dehydrogenase
MPTHARIIQEYARLASQERFQGTLFVLTNPVDLLTYILYYTSQQEAHPLRTYQVYGLGLEIDIARARYFLSEMGLHFTEDEIKAFGNHSDTFVFQTPLSDAENAELAERVKVASQQVRQYIPRTVYGPVTAARRSLEAFLDHSDTSLAVLQRESFVGMPIRFHQGLPMFPDDGSETHYRAILDQNRETTTRF